jgi:hypothetical protein
MRKVGLLRDRLANPLAGRMTALLDLASRLPWDIWYECSAAEISRRFVMLNEVKHPANSAETLRCTQSDNHWLI